LYGTWSIGAWAFFRKKWRTIGMILVQSEVSDETLGKNGERLG
jgi:hypothetical protein